MKKHSLCAIACAMSILLSGCAASGETVFHPWSLLFLAFALLVAVPAAYGTLNYRRYLARKRRERARKRDIRPMHPFIYGMYGAVIVLLVLFFVFVRGAAPSAPSDTAAAPETTATTVAFSEPADPNAPATPAAGLTPASVAQTAPAQWGVRWEIFEGTTALTSYQRRDAVAFDEPDSYFALNGIAAFRGNNYRDSATFGTADVKEQTVSTVWTVPTGTLTNADGTTWEGSGWTGQPLIVEWPAAVRKIMNLYENKQQKDGLVEVIYATLDGKIYFLDLDDGSFTRDPLNIGMPFKGAGSLDPRGYPLMYVGSGDENSSGASPRMYIISLIDGSILYEYGHDDPLSQRTDNDNWCAFDSSPLVCAANDTLIWPGENGLLYTMRLNTLYDTIGGTIKIAPSTPIVTRYSTSRSSNDSYWIGYEAGCVVVDHYLYVSENGGLFYCVDLNTMSLVWTQDTKDDSNSTPVFEKVSDTAGYLYTAPSLHWTANNRNQGTIGIYKLDAVTGEIVWQKNYDVNTVSGVSGGVQSSPLLGKKGTTLENTIIYSISRTPSSDEGLLVALDTASGEERWRMAMTHYAWSSPVAVYDDDGTGYVVVCDSGGELFFLDGKTGELLYTETLGSMVEASPAVFGDRLVVGTKCRKIRGLEIQ